MVSDRVAVSRTVLSSLHVHGAEVSEALEKLLFPKGPPAHLTVERLLAALGQVLEQARSELMTADLANAAELADDEAPRAARDQAIADVRARLISIRGTLSAVFGSGILTTYGLGGETPDDVDLLAHRAASVASLLAERPIVEKPKQAGVTVDAAALAQSLQQPMKNLTAALGDVRREEREAQLTLKARNAALAVWNARYQGVADVATGLFELVERGDLADLVRPTARRRAGLAEQADLPASPAADPAKPA
ncbi:MAG: hypothetical protein ABIV93_20500 [Byssovorax sp.]